MGVVKLWDVLRASGRQVNESSLRRKRVAIDVSIWLNKFIKVIQKSGKSNKLAHIPGIFRRCCKLLFFQIQPIFVFDGGVPQIKLNTIIKRKNRKEISRKRLNETARKLMITRLGQFASDNTKDTSDFIQNLKEEIESILGTTTGTEDDDDEFAPRERQPDSTEINEDEFSSSSEELDYENMFNDDSDSGNTTDEDIDHSNSSENETDQIKSSSSQPTANEFKLPPLNPKSSIPQPEFEQIKSYEEYLMIEVCFIII